MAPPKAKPSKSTAGSKGKVDEKKQQAPPEVQLFHNEYTAKLKDSLKKQLQGTKGFPEKLKSVLLN